MVIAYLLGLFVAAILENKQKSQHSEFGPGNLCVMRQLIPKNGSVWHTCTPHINNNSNNTVGSFVYLFSKNNNNNKVTGSFRKS